MNTMMGNMPQMQNPMMGMGGNGALPQQSGYPGMWGMFMRGMQRRMGMPQMAQPPAEITNTSEPNYTPQPAPWINGGWNQFSAPTPQSTMTGTTSVRPPPQVAPPVFRGFENPQGTTNILDRLGGRGAVNKLNERSKKKSGIRLIGPGLLRG